MPRRTRAFSTKVSFLPVEDSTRTALCSSKMEHVFTGFSPLRLSHLEMAQRPCLRSPRHRSRTEAPNPDRLGRTTGQPRRTMNRRISSLRPRCCHMKAGKFSNTSDRV
ncbi:hypothetical protein L596_017476 [Steinernema carpocapsae]|uniref:Uncharacterized protein n=1 Tax=Steinernema carpocapsae TaxID=34508 RepID=A0A4U5N208_STECR|nr:hypothetical protein L596_017476 [Steinernema carpocapsae]